MERRLCRYCHLLHRVDQRRHSLNANLEAIAGLDWADAARCAGDDHIAREQRHVGGDEADQLITIENQLARVRILTKLAVLEKLNGEIVRIDLRFDVWPERSERVERFRARPLALGILNRAIADILRGGVAEDISRGRGGGDVANTSSDYNR